ncbi:hypothetical protein [Roseibium aggregatum]|uniref:hypothetical protein n=1 Tax=Roseibium aggregatum TaxID=187304 RepID=UPI0025AD6F53|nr:hypothetical protein [Roseibium aggregatum]WJS05501.1 hypothetical protein QUB73_27160 [Roseibium aggregatum]
MINLSEQSIGDLKKIISELKKELGSWGKTSELLCISEHKIKEFIDEESTYILPALDILTCANSINAYIGTNKESVINKIFYDEILKIFPSKRERDRYSVFKEMTGLSEADQSIFSKKISGYYIAARPFKGETIFISHLRILDTFQREGLPTCVMSRRLTTDGDLIIPGSVFSNNNKIFIIGFDTTSRNVRSLKLIPLNEEFSVLTGFVTGFENNGDSFAAKIIIGRMNKRHTYSEIRNDTGLFDEKEMIEAIFKKYIDFNLVGSTYGNKIFEPDSYSKISMGF